VRCKQVAASKMARETRGEMRIHSCIRGYHVYNAIWTASVGEELPCRREVTNAIDQYAVAVVKDSQVVGHLPLKIS